MPTVLLCAAAGADRDFLGEALGRGGYGLRLLADGLSEPGVEPPCAVVAELGVALDLGWVRTAAPTTPPGPLVLCSRFAEFLERLGPRASAVLLLPATEQEVLSAVERARRGELTRPQASPDPLDGARDRRLAAGGLLRPGAEPELSGIADLVARAVGANIGLVTVVDSTWQTFLGASGLGPDLSAARGTPRSWSFCQHVVRSSAPLVVPDARAHPVLAVSPLVELGLLASYVGYPIEVEGLGTVGSVCAIDEKARAFSSSELASVQLAARLVSEILSRRSRARAAPPLLPPPLPAAGELGPGALLDGKYWITAVLGEGGQGRVLLGRDRVLGRLLAIKVSFAQTEGALLREAETLGQLRHRNIVQLYGWGKLPSGEAYLAMEYVEGESLGEHVDRVTDAGEWVAPARVADIVGQLSGALASMHALGYVHGDVKPANVLLDPTLDRAVLIDFGLGLHPATRSLGRGFGGTVGYSAPEQLQHDEQTRPGPRFDVYGLAAVAYQMLTGEGPFGAPDRAGALARQQRGEINRLALALPWLPAPVGDVLAGALSASPADRPPSTLAFSEALGRALVGADASPEQPASGEPRSRGVVFRELREELRRWLGREGEGRLVEGLSPGHAAAVKAAVDDAALYPTEALVSYLRAYAGADLGRLEALGERLVGEGMQAAIRSLHLARTPAALLGALPVLLGRFHRLGPVNVRREDSNRVTVELWLDAELSPVLCALLGGTLRGLLSSTAQRGSVSHEQCRARGAPACVLAVRWQSER